MRKMAHLLQRSAQRGGQPGKLGAGDQAKKEPAQIRGVRREVRELFQENSLLKLNLEE